MADFIYKKDDGSQVKVSLHPVFTTDYEGDVVVQRVLYDVFTRGFRKKRWEWVFASESRNIWGMSAEDREIHKAVFLAKNGYAEYLKRAFDALGSNVKEEIDRNWERIQKNML